MAIPIQTDYKLHIHQHYYKSQGEGGDSSGKPQTWYKVSSLKGSPKKHVTTMPSVARRAGSYESTGDYVQ